MRGKIFKEDLQKIISSDLPWGSFYGKTILVTGANGFIAGYIVETLLYLNEVHKGNPIRIVCLVRDRNAASQRYSQYNNRDEIIYWVQDVCAPFLGKERVDYIIHAASFATPSKYGVDPVGTLLPNVIGTYNLLEYARKSSIKGFLFISSCEIYGDLGNNMVQIHEDDMGIVHPTALRSCYAESKRMGETMCVGWNSQHQVPTKIARLFHTYGPRMRLADGRVYSDFVGSIVNNNNIVIKSDGRAKRSFCYVTDTVIGLFTILLKGKNGQAYNVGNDTAISIKDLAISLQSFYPDKHIQIIHERRKNDNQYLASQIKTQCPSIEKIGKLGWAPKYSLQKGFTRTIESFMVR